MGPSWGVSLEQSDGLPAGWRTSRFWSAAVTGAVVGKVVGSSDEGGSSTDAATWTERWLVWWRR